MDPAEAARIANTVVRVCARDHAIVMYSARRDQPEPPCPTCGRKQGGVAGEEKGEEDTHG